ncbi:CPBP family intramembrane glutamic endopeptidase [Mechercharimyces sp. CAU 1602]|uniref:CPBP family intramembrane glutamic endopeptidase n=1 Tax=Mechercharimyces sp. CAU 1602 TaxID=2973933 RepID=UPI002162F6DE|nr:type II CAAX endopeptidase family protein [Mechercharimyces sp. CAU 1602]MCS1352316.1 CPBP family intramembrane metalloprotease [Mechercharimyces sp. CAU 1602]
MLEILSMIFTFLPFIFILVLANVVDRLRSGGDNPSAGTVVGVITILLTVGLLLLSWLLAIGNMMLPAFTGETITQANTSALFMEKLPYIVGISISTLLGMFLLIPAVRRLVAKVIPINPTQQVHAVSLSFSTLILLQMFMTLGMGLDSLADLEQQMPLASIWAQDIMLFILGLLGVGWVVRHQLTPTLNRLGIVLPTLSNVATGVFMGFALFAIIISIELIFNYLGIAMTNKEVEDATESLIGPLTASLPGVLTLGFAAALGEETIFRGALLPRFGLVLSSLLFALLHSQYGLSSSTFIVFILGLILGVIRMRTNTTTAMLTHATYNISLGLIALYAT